MDTETNELRIESRARNNRLWELIFEIKKYDSVSAFSKSFGVNEVQIGAYLNLKKSPVKQRGEVWRVDILRLCDALNVDPYYLFPLELHAKKNQEIVKPLYIAELKQRLGYDAQQALELDRYLESDAFTDTVKAALNTLHPRESKIFAMRFGLRRNNPKTLNEIAATFRVTHERVRQIEAKAIRKLQHPSRSRLLRDAALASDFNKEFTKKGKFRATKQSKPRLVALAKSQKRLEPYTINAVALKFKKGEHHGRDHKANSPD